MNSTPRSNPDTAVPLTRREMLGYAQIAAFWLLLVGAGVFLILFVLAQPEWVDLGTTQEFQVDTPVPRTLTRRDQSTVTVWVVFTQDQWLVFDARVPFHQGCFVRYQSMTQRFEDPCTAAKFSITGQFVDPYGGWAGQRVRDLDRFAVSIREGHVFIDANRVIHAEPFIAPGLLAGSVGR